MIGKIKRKISYFKHKIEIALKGKTLFRDKFGLSYYLWANTRVDSTINHTRVRTDDTGVIKVSSSILDEYTKFSDDNICLDVGGFIGVITLSMAQSLRGRGQIFTFEAFDQTFVRLVENVKSLNKYKNVFLFNSAVSDYVGRAGINTVENAGGTYINNLDPAVINTAQTISLVTTLNHFTECYGLSQITLMKVDAEGVDDKVLSGASNLMANGSIDYIIIEYDGDMGIRQNIDKLLLKYNYQKFYIIRNGCQIVEEMDNYPKDIKAPLNILAVSPSARIKDDILNTLVLRK